MDRFFLEASAITPYVEFDRGTGVFIIQGKSLPEDVKSYYMPLVQWWDNYIKNPNPSTNLVLDFDYFNTASSKMLLILLNKVKELHKSGKEVLITWKYPQLDAELEEAGEEFAELLNVPFEMIAKPID